MTGKILILFLAVSMAAPLLAEKPVWEWTLEERIAARTDAAAARNRVRNVAAGRTRIGANAATSERRVDAFDGKSHPELFLPHEVFRTLITHAFLGEPRSAQRFRRGFQPQVAKYGLPADFWQKLEAMTTVYVADMNAEHDIGAGLVKPDGAVRAERTAQALALKKIDVCRSRAAAIEAARKEFGAARLERFLYETIAVNMFHVADTLPDAELLRQQARGCR